MSKKFTKPSAVAFLVYPYINDPLYPEPRKHSAAQYKIDNVFENNGLVGFSIFHLPEKEESKPHIHVMVLRPSRCGFTMDTWHEIANMMHAANNHVEILIQPHEYARYLTHNGYSDKVFHYESDQVHCYGQIDYKAYCAIDDAKAKVQTDPNEILTQVIEFINAYQIFYYSELVDFAIHQSPEWFPVIKANCNFLKTYLRSCEYKYRIQDESVFNVR